MTEQKPEKVVEQQTLVKVIAFSREECPFDKPREHTWRQWHSFRNHVLDILSRYGTVGPMGKMPMLDTREESDNEWQVANKNSDFFVVDDDTYGNAVRVEAACTLVKPLLLQEVAMLLAPLPDWSVYLALRKGGLWIFHDRILFEGDFFAGCCSVSDLYHRCALGADGPNTKCC